MRREEINIAIVGGDNFAREVLETIIRYYGRDRKVNARIKAIAYPDPYAPAMRLAKEMGWDTFLDYHDLYKDSERIDVILILVPEEAILEDILLTSPPRIRVVSYLVFRLFWDSLKFETSRLKEKTQELEAIFQSIQDSILVISSNFDVEEVNEAALKQMGYERKEVIGKKCYELFQRSNRRCEEDDLFCPLKAVRATQKPCKRILPRINRKGEVVYLEITIYPIVDEEGDLVKFVEISRDVSDNFKKNEEVNRQLEELLKKTYEELEQRREELIHQDKMASLGKLSAAVVHEINNPISGILNLVLLIKRILQEDGPTEENFSMFRRHLDLMESEIRRISRITSNLLTFSKGKRSEMNVVSVNQLLEEVLFLYSNMLKINHIQLKKKLSPNLPDIVADGEQIKQVIMNLISNAIEAMDKSREKILSVETKESENRVHLIISDTGCGIQNGVGDKIFEPFFTTKKKGKGVGLGLSVVYGIIKQHGGAIKVETKKGQGTTFIIELPLTQPLEKYH